jgi:hypothetical protein
MRVICRYSVIDGAGRGEAAGEGIAGGFAVSVIGFFDGLVTRVSDGLPATTSGVL